MDTPTAHIDGASRGNPGPAAYAVILRRPGHPAIEEAKTIGTATNNVAEYTALVRALELAGEQDVKALSVFSDSELLVKQMNGEYRVKSADLQGLYAEAKDLAGKLDRVTFTHVRREQNADADRLCNVVLDGEKKRKKLTAPPPESGPPRVSGGAPEPLEEEALAMLNAAAKAWAAGKEEPSPVDVWDRLWQLLGEHRVLR